MIDLQGKTPKNIQDTPVIKLNAPRSSNLRKYTEDPLIGIICEISSSIQASYNYDIILLKVVFCRIIIIGRFLGRLVDCVEDGSEIVRFAVL